MSKRYVFVTRYALSAGVTRREVIKTYGTDSVCVAGMEYGILYPNRDFYDDEKEALDAADKMRIKKIAALKKQIATLEATVFTIKEPK